MVSQFQGSCLGICWVWGLNLSHRLTHYEQVAMDTEPKHLSIEISRHGTVGPRLATFALLLEKFFIGKDC